MLTIYKDRLIHIEWTIYKGTSSVREDFTRALVKCFLIGPREKYLVNATAQSGTLYIELPQGLEEGSYSIEAIYVKNQGNLTPRREPLSPGNAPDYRRTPYPPFKPHDARYNDRCIMRSRRDCLFAITEYEQEEEGVPTASSGEVTLRFSTSTSSYGYDGLSAYEIAVMRGDFNGSEGDYVNSSKIGIATSEKIGGITADEKTSKDVVEARIDPKTGKMFVEPVGQGGVTYNFTNYPDDEDLAEEEKENKKKVMKLADKEYNAAGFSGLGRVYLRKNISESNNILTQEMIDSTNTRYIIQYDYDLGGNTINIPENCLLDFQGGSLSNGIINGSKFRIKSELNKIFNNIQFTGDVTKNVTFEVDWFVSKYETYFSESPQTDSTDELQQMFDCGIENIHFNNNKFFNVTKTLSINHHINITGARYRERHFGNARTISVNYNNPCIFTCLPITVLKYIQKPDKDTYRPVNIGGFNILCCYDYSVNYVKSETPLVEIYCGDKEGGTRACIWGLNIDINITNICRFIDENPQDVYPNMIGILFHTAGDDQNYITYVTIDGYIQGVISCIDTKIEGTSWMTSFTDNTDKNWCVHASRCYASPFIINGTAQNNYNRFVGLSPSVAFVEGGQITLNGTLWDVPVTQVAVKCASFTNNCPTFMGNIKLTGNNGYTDYLPNSLSEVPYQGKSNNILEGLTDNKISPLLTKLYDDYTYNRKASGSIISNYDIELYNSTNPETEYTSIKGTLKDELNIFNSNYLGQILTNAGAYLKTGYYNTFTKKYSTNTSLRYTFTLSNLFVLDYSSYILTHVGDFKKVRIKIQYRNSSDSLIKEEILKETSASDYYRNIFYTHVGILRGMNNYQYLYSGKSKIIVEYENVTGTAMCPPVGLFNSTYNALGTSGGNIVGRVNIQDVVHATPSSDSMDIYYAYNKHYGRSKTLSSTYERVFCVKCEYKVQNKIYFSFRSGQYWNYIEVTGVTPKAYIGDKNVTVQVNTYRSGSFLYVEISIKSTVSYSIDFGKLFSNYGLEFIDDDSTELDSIVPTTTELKSSYWNNVTSSEGDTTHKILKLKLPKNSFTGIISTGIINNRALFAINLSTQTGGNAGQPYNLYIQRIATIRNNSTNISAIAYCDNSIGMNIIEITIGDTRYAKAEVLPLNGAVYDTEYISESEYDESSHLSLISSVVVDNILSGSSDDIPEATYKYNGDFYFDTTLKKPLWVNNGDWVDSDGLGINIKKVGTFEERPNKSLIPIGFQYFCTNKNTEEGQQMGILIINKGEDVWVDSLGRTIV